jgi:hypothetical protein
MSKTWDQAEGERIFSGVSGEIHERVMVGAYRELGSRKGAGEAVKQDERMSSPTLKVLQPG